MLHGHCPLFTVYEYKTEPLELLWPPQEYENAYCN
jgi:hypothetical protein